MHKHLKMLLVFCVLAGALITAGCATQPQSSTIPQYKVDPFWPKPLQDNWIWGQVSSVAVDNQDHLWVLHRPDTLLDDDKGAQKKPAANRCCLSAPPVVEFDSQGNIIQGWGGLGKPGKSEGSNSTSQLGRPAAVESDAGANEIYVSDGYGNRRVIVFDATTGAYKRHWGAYGAVPSDEKVAGYKPGGEPSKQFGNPHCLRFSKDNLLYVCDRPNNRIQVFQKNGTFVREFLIEADTLTGPLADLVMSRDSQQQFLLVADGSNSEIYVLGRADGRKLASFGRPGRMAGEFRSLHNIAIDSRGNIYTAEAGFGRRVQKFLLQ